MESLALMASIIFLTVLLIGPISLIFSYLKFIPRIIVVLTGCFSVFVGFYWLMLPISLARAFGLIPIFMGLRAIDKRVRDMQKESQDEE